MLCLYLRELFLVGPSSGYKYKYGFINYTGSLILPA